MDYAQVHGRQILGHKTLSALLGGKKKVVVNSKCKYHIQSSNDVCAIPHELIAFK
jgi:hypothetical protein